MSNFLSVLPMPFASYLAERGVTVSGGIASMPLQVPASFLAAFLSMACEPLLVAMEKSGVSALTLVAEDGTALRCELSEVVALRAAYLRRVELSSRGLAHKPERLDLPTSSGSLDA